jgi:sialate O-acetylesterase
VSARLRRADSYEPLGSASVGSRAHLRLRLVKGAGVQSTLFVDTLSGATWTQMASFAIPDDSDLYGRQLALANLSGGRLPVLRLTGVSTVPAANLTLRRSLDRLDAWKLFQRGPAGTAPIPVPFSYRSPVDSRLEVRIVARANGLPLPGFDFANWRFDLAPAPNGAEAEVTITGVPGGGNYDLEARLVEIGSGFVRGTDLVTQIAVGDVFLAAGQSNMSGYAGALEPREPAIDEVHLFGNDYRWRQAAEPIDSGVDERDLVSQDTREEHSLMLRFAKEVRAAVGVPIAILPAARGGTSLQADWSRDNGDPESRFTLYGSAIHRVRAQGYQHPIRGVIWYQGEQDVGLGTDEYLADLQALVANLRTDLANPSLFFGNCQLATREGTVLSVWLEIQEAQRRLALLDPLTSVIATVDLARADFVHLNIDSYKTAGTRLARSVVHGSYGITQNRGPKLLSASFDGMDRSRVKLTYDENVTGGSSFLYEVLSDSVPVSVVSASASGTVVTLQLAAPANGTVVSVSYGFSEFPAAPWVVATDGSGAALTFKGLPVN